MLYLNSLVFEEGNLRGALRCFDHVKKSFENPKATVSDVLTLSGHILIYTAPFTKCKIMTCKYLGLGLGFVLAKC